MFHNMIEKSVHKSQHCQRNWDLSKEVPDRDLKVMETAVTQCPSKQNYAYYKPYIITNREIIEKIYHQTDGFIINREGDSIKNVQVLANVLVVFAEDNEYMKIDVRDKNAKLAIDAGKELPEQERQRNISMGIAAGYLNLSATMLGYSTGCCTCFNAKGIQKVLGIEEHVLLLMGVGWADENRPRREKHDDKDFIYPTFKKNLQAVRVT
jgi:nitroreductase